MCAKVINAVLILQVLAHSIFGCCWHHAHTDCTHVAVAHVGASGLSHATHKCGHEHGPLQVADADTTFPDAPCPAPKSCDNARCLFVKAQPGGDLTETLFKLMAFQAIAFSRFAEFVSEEPIVAPRPPHIALRCYSSVERCALLQAWLI